MRVAFQIRRKWTGEHHYAIGPWHETDSYSNIILKQEKTLGQAVEPRCLYLWSYQPVIDTSRPSQRTVLCSPQFSVKFVSPGTFSDNFQWRV